MQHEMRGPWMLLGEEGEKTDEARAGECNGSIISELVTG